MAVIDNDWKMISQPKQQGRLIELFNLSKDQNESEQSLPSSSTLKVTQLRKVLVDARNLDRKKASKGKTIPRKQCFLNRPESSGLIYLNIKNIFQNGNLVLNMNRG